MDNNINEASVIQWYAVCSRQTVIQWNLYNYSGHPTSWLLYRGGLFIQCNVYYSGHPRDTTSWLLYRGGLLIQWNLYSGHP